MIVRARRPGPLTFWKVLKGPPLRVNLEKWFDSFCSNYEPDQTRQGCATRLWNPKKHIFRIDPLPWTLNLRSDTECLSKGCPGINKKNKQSRYIPGARTPREVFLVRAGAHGARSANQRRAEEVSTSGEKKVM